MSFITYQNIKRKQEADITPIYPTSRFKINASNKFVLEGGSSNAGLAAYALETICHSEHIFRMVPFSVVQFLHNAIVVEAVISGERTAWWRWEKSPARPDYRYPFDWDDQFKAMDGILAYRQKRMVLSDGLKLPTPKEIFRKISKSIYESSKVGEDVLFRIPHKIALYIFDESDGSKIGNKEDVFVTAVALESASRHGLYGKQIEFRDLANELFQRLVYVAYEGLRRKLPFHTISRCYFSWAHYIYLLQKISIILNVEIDIKELKEYYKTIINNEAPTTFERANEKHDSLYRRLLGINIDRGAFSPISSETIVYRHRRLSHYYGFRLWDSILLLLNNSEK